MSGRLPIATIFGTRPEAVKMAPVVAALRASADFTPLVLVTGQHRQMLDQVLSVFEIQPDRDLDIMLPEQTLEDIISRSLAGLSRALEELRPAFVLVQGDAHTTFVGALAAYYRRIPVGHVEAGLRTADKYQPFPEEMNRRLAGVLVDLHFAPTPRARANLLREGVDPAGIFVTGNTEIDALMTILRGSPPGLPAHLPSLNGRRVMLVTTHRRESWGEPLRQVYLGLLDLLERFQDVELVFAVHLNPAVRRIVDAVLAGHRRAHLIEPPDYATFVRLMRRADLILTDSGGIQEAAPSLGKPVLVLREKTERIEGVEAGTARLVGTDRARIVTEASRLLSDAAAYGAMSQAQNPYGDGHAAERIVEALRYYFKRRADRPSDFAAPQSRSSTARSDRM